MRLRVTLSTQSESAAFRRISLISSSGDLWCGVVHDGVNSLLGLHQAPSTNEVSEAGLGYGLCSVNGPPHHEHIYFDMTD